MTNESYNLICKALAQIIKGSEFEGHVFLVGGCVRDEIMHTKIHDIDIAVTLPNGGVRFALWLYKKRLTAGKRPPLVFEHFATAKVRLKQFPKEVIDCVQTRKNRYVFEEDPKPEEHFGTIEEDALCRDLTINSLFKNISTNELLDPTGLALHDIENHIIRTPNIPDISLRDNAMHILRCIRFAVKFEWEISLELLESMKKNLDIMSEATVRRMTNELFSILQLKKKERAFKLIKSIGAMPYIEPYLKMIQEGTVSMNISKGKKPQKKRRKKGVEKEGRKKHRSNNSNKKKNLQAETNNK